MSAPFRVVVVEDHPSMRTGLELLLDRRGFEMVGAADSYAQGSELIAERRPDVAIIDIELGDGSGTALARAVAEAYPEVAVVLYTAYADHHLLEEAVDSGAKGVVLKTASVDELARAVHAAGMGATFVDHRVSAALRAANVNGRRVLSRREAHVLSLLAHGYSTAQVGEELSLTELTVDSHVRNACSKLGADSRLQALVLALESGDLELSELPAAAQLS